jgi:hypothetical protein
MGAKGDINAWSCPLVAIAICCESAASAASSDYYLTIKGVSQAPKGGPIYLQVSAGDLDGDGLPDDNILRLDCGTGTVPSASLLGGLASHDATSGLPTGKRQHKPFTIVQEWSPATPELSAMRPTWDVKKIEGARIAADDWTDALSNADGQAPQAGRRASVSPPRSSGSK